MSKPKLLISSCLAGEFVRYDSNNNLINDFDKLKNDFELCYVCPEVQGGMQIPREASEITSFNPLQVLSKKGVDNSHFFIKGASIALNMCKELDIKYALLKSKSPSCGNKKIYDGTFNGNLISAMGVTATTLSNNNIKVFNENEIKELYELTFR